MNLIVVGLSHKTAPVEVREQLAFKPTGLSEVCRRITNGSDTREAMVLSTCNRVEVYAVADSPERGFASVSGFLSGCTDHLTPRDLEPHLYHYPGNAAIGHMFRVASSLDSMVLGEPQILGQFKNAFESALEAKSTGMVLNKVAKKAISVAKRVRTETRIAENAVSVSYAAVELARKVFGDLSRQRVMLLGAGEMAELALRHLVSAGCDRIAISTRTLENARRLADEFRCGDGVSADAVPFEQFAERLTDVDIVLCSTGAPDFVVTPEMMQRAVRARKNRPMFLIDISVPRNIDPAVNRLDDVYLYDVDDLQSVVESNLKERQEEARKAMNIVEQEVDTTARWIRSLDVVPTITALRGHAETIALREVERVLGRLGHLSEKERALIEGLGASIVAKLLHTPLTTLRKDAQENNGGDMVETTRRLFALPDENEEKPPAQERRDQD